MLSPLGDGKELYIRSYDRLTLKTLKCLHTYFQSGYINLHAHQAGEGGSFPMSWPVCVLNPLVDLNHSNWGKIKSQ